MVGNLGVIVGGWFCTLGGGMTLRAVVGGGFYTLGGGMTSYGWCFLHRRSWRNWFNRGQGRGCSFQDGSNSTKGGSGGISQW